jgi:hypothetical protein
LGVKTKCVSSKTIPFWVAILWLSFYDREVSVAFHMLVDSHTLFGCGVELA